MTAQARAGMARVLDLELALLAAEVQLREELVAAGIMPEDARREPTAPELRSGVRFAELDRIVNDSAGLISRKADAVRDKVLDGLAELLGHAFAEPDPYVLVRYLNALADPTSGRTLPGLRDVIDATVRDVTADLERTAAAGAAEAIDEAKRQGIPDALIGDVEPVDDTVHAAAEAHAQRVANTPAQRLLNVAAEAAQRAAVAPGAGGGDVVTAALDAAEEASRAGQDDTARQAANVAHGLGRTNALVALPDPAEVYASELLDSHTCGPCATVDGRTYADLAAALVDYPGAGGFVGCDGGSRCRGTLVLVHRSEAAPTLDNPGQGPGAPGGPADRTPRGPASPAPAPATGPLEPDHGIAPSSTDYSDLDDAGRTVMPVEHLKPPIDTVAPANVDLDPERAYGDWDDAQLERALRDPFASDAERIGYADELDGRAAGRRSRVRWDETTLAPDELATFEREREAWEASGGGAADAYASANAKGRRIDRIRDEWTSQVEMDYLAAENATRGSLLRRDRVEEYRRKYGTSTGPLMEGPSRIAYYYASPELRDHWASLGGRKTFAEFAVERGITDAKTLARAQAAARARADAERLAEESVEKRAARKAANARNRRPLSAGERLEQERRRRDRIKARERKLQAEAGYTPPTEE